MEKAKIVQLTVLQAKSKEAVRNWMNCDLNLETDEQGELIYKPFLIRTNFFSFFRCLIDNIDSVNPKILGDCTEINQDVKNERKELVRRNIERTKSKLKTNINFLQNSSIWIRFCDNGDWDGSDENNKSDEIKESSEEFHWFEALKLYEFKPAKEYILYQLRTRLQNYLDVIGDEGHGVHITPVIYSDEVVFRDFFLKEQNSPTFKFLATNESNEDFQTNDITLRVLLVDDRISKSVEQQPISECDKDCIICSDKDSCKLRVINSLISGRFILDDQKKESFKKHTYWDADNVKSFVLDSIKISHIWDVNQISKSLIQKQNADSIKVQLDKNLQENRSCVQILGVRDLETALSLMSCCKFDIILLDYLLGERSINETERTYSTELFEFLSYDFKKGKDAPAIIEMLKNNNLELGDDQLNEFQDIVKLNRGPIDRFWIVPMTSYNSSFISDLQRKHVRLIDHRWNISQGADPINTPWRFLHKLNEFIDLQLRSCVFHMEQLLRFLKYTCDYSMEFNKKAGVMNFYDFQSFMGAEYATFMQLYGNRLPIKRDAINETKSNATDNKSAFATYIWDNFYRNPDYYDAIELNRLAHRFYYQASTMYNDRAGRQRLNEAFANLDFFVRTNNRIKEILKLTNHKDLLPLTDGNNGLAYLRTVIAECTKD